MNLINIQRKCVPSMVHHETSLAFILFTTREREENTEALCTFLLSAQSKDSKGPFGKQGFYRNSSIPNHRLIEDTHCSKKTLPNRIYADSEQTPLSFVQYWRCHRLPKL